MTLLDVAGLTKGYPKFTLSDVSFQVRAGQVMGLIGRNGAGKSTTIKCMLNLVHPDKGRVMIGGRVFSQEEAACKQILGLVLGGEGFYPRKTLRAVTAAARRLYPRWDESGYRRYLKEFQLDEDKTSAQLSQGMRVKYQLALALSHGAQMFILDEPTSGLDPVSRDELMEIFRALVQDGKRGILFSTHITDDLEKCADGVTYLREGRVEATGEKAEFLRQFSHLRREDGTPPATLDDVMVLTERQARHEITFL